MSRRIEIGAIGKYEVTVLNENNCSLSASKFLTNGTGQSH